MTLAPLVDPTVHGVEGKPGILGFPCAAPTCTQPAQQRHHIWPRSYLRGQPVEWVSVQGIIIQNTCGLCIPHHDAVTVGQAHIRWNEGLQVLEWWDPVKGTQDEWWCVGLLKGEEAPLVRAAEREVEAEKVRKAEGLCPSCGRPKRMGPKALPKRKTKTWTVNVPDDTEDGAAVLDEYVDDLSVALGFGDESKGVRRYHVLANVLLWVTQMKPEFLADWREADEPGSEVAPRLSA